MIYDIDEREFAKFLNHMIVKLYNDDECRITLHQMDTLTTAMEKRLRMLDERRTIRVLPELDGDLLVDVDNGFMDDVLHMTLDHELSGYTLRTKFQSLPKDIKHHTKERRPKESYKIKRHRRSDYV